MARYTGPKCRLCRREGEKLFLKGTRCLSDKCAVGRRNQPPGPKYLRTRRGFSDYGRHLREKQKVKRIYGLLELQFRKYYEEASRQTDVTGHALLKLLESRIDSVLFSAGYAISRATARQKTRQNKVLINGKPVNIPSYQVKVGDEIQFGGIETAPKSIEDLPGWMHWDNKKKCIVVDSLPERKDVSYEINEQLIVEYYSR